MHIALKDNQIEVYQETIEPCTQIFTMSQATIRNTKVFASRRPTLRGHFLALYQIENICCRKYVAKIQIDRYHGVLQKWLFLQIIGRMPPIDFQSQWRIVVPSLGEMTCRGWVVPIQLSSIYALQKDVIQVKVENLIIFEE